MTKSTKRRPASSRPETNGKHDMAKSDLANRDKAKRPKARTRAASVSPQPIKSSAMGRTSGAKAAIGRASDPGDSEAAQAVLDALAHWREEMSDVAQKMASDPGKAGAQQMVHLLGGQRRVLEQVKASLTEFQRMIETCEDDLKRHPETAATTALPGMLTAFNPAGVIQRGAIAAMQAPMKTPLAPVTAPMSAMLSMQKAALTSVGVWAKVAQDCHGMWFGAMQAMAPGNGVSHDSDEREQDRSRRRDKRDRS